MFLEQQQENINWIWKYIVGPDGDRILYSYVTATSYAGDGSAFLRYCTDNVRTGILDVAKFTVRLVVLRDYLVGSGITLSPDGDVILAGVVTATSFIGDGSSYGIGLLKCKNRYLRCRWYCNI